MVLKPKQRTPEEDAMANHRDSGNGKRLESGKEQSTNGVVVRSRRTHSVGRAQDIQVKEKRERAEQPDHP